VLKIWHLPSLFTYNWHLLPVIINNSSTPWRRVSVREKEKASYRYVYYRNYRYLLITAGSDRGGGL